MEQIKKFFAHKIFKILKWAFLILVVSYLVLVIFRVFHLFNVEKTNKQVEIIHSTKITIEDALGKNLPPDPGQEADKTVEGIDVNKNGIRDDVELAIFKAYPDSAKTRAALLQYVLALQMGITQKFINTNIATEISREVSRGSDCIGRSTTEGESSFDEYLSLTQFARDTIFNTRERKNAETSFFEKVRSYSDLEEECDIDYSKLPN